jgi:hypothetical protein
LCALFPTEKYIPDAFIKFVITCNNILIHEILKYPNTMAKQEQWHEVELVAMLAWFAHCVQSKVEFDETVLRKMTDALEETCERESILTFNDVEKKLRDLSRSSSFRSPIEIAREGTGFFTHLSPQIQEDISNAAKMHATLKKEDKKGSKTDCDAQLDRSLVNISRTRSSGPYTERHQGNWTEKAPRSCWECKLKLSPHLKVSNYRRRCTEEITLRIDFRGRVHLLTLSSSGNNMSYPRISREP